MTYGSSRGMALRLASEAVKLQKPAAACRVFKALLSWRYDHGATIATYAPEDDASKPRQRLTQRSKIMMARIVAALAGCACPHGSARILLAYARVSLRQCFNYYARVWRLPLIFDKLKHQQRHVNMSAAIMKTSRFSGLIAAPKRLCISYRASDGERRHFMISLLA